VSAPPAAAPAAAAATAAAEPKPRPAPPIAAAAPTMKPDEAIVIPYVDTTLAPPPSGPARPDPGAFQPDAVK